MQPSVSELMARIQDLEILVGAWQGKADSNEAIISVMRRNEEFLRSELRKTKERCADLELRVEDLLEQLTRIPLEDGAVEIKQAEEAEKASGNITRLSGINTLPMSYREIENISFCPQCWMVMPSQCGARCQLCGFKTSCSMDP